MSHTTSTITSKSIQSLIDQLKSELLNQSMKHVKQTAKALEDLVEQIIDVENQFAVFSALALYNQKGKNYDQAAKYCRKAILLTKDFTKEDKEKVVNIHLQYAHLEREYKQFANARINLAKIMEWLEKHKCDEPYLNGLVFSHLGKVSMDEEDYESALNYSQQSFVYLNKALPSKHPLIMSSINTLTELYVKTEDYESAVKLQKELLEQYQKENHITKQGLTLLRLGELYFYINLKEARGYLKKSLDHFKDDSFQTLNYARALLLLAELEENTGKVPRSINYYKKAYEKLDGAIDENHFLIVFIYSKLGTLSFKTNELEQARFYLEKGLPLAASYEKIKMQFLYALGKLYSNEQEYKKANEHYLQFLQILDDGNKRKTKAYADTLQSLAYNYLENQQYEQALDYYLQALEIYQRFTPCKEEQGFTKIRIAHCYENQTTPDLLMAEKYYEGGFEIIEKLHNKDLQEEALAGIIEFYLRNDNPLKRKKYENKFVKLSKSN